MEGGFVIKSVFKWVRLFSAPTECVESEPTTMGTIPQNPTFDT